MPSMTKESYVGHLGKSILDVISILLYIVDIGSDIILALSYYNNGHFTYFGLTLAFVIIPAIITNLGAFSKMYTEPFMKSSMAKCCRYSFSFCCMGLLWMMIETSYYKWQRRKKKNSDIETEHYSYLNLMVLIEALFESGPQLILQLYILIRNTVIIKQEFALNNYPDIRSQLSGNLTMEELNQLRLTDFNTTQTVLQIISICSSSISISFSLTNFMRKLNDSDRENFKSWACYFLWHLVSITGRIFVLSLFASAFTFWVSLVFAFRIILIVMLIRYLLNETQWFEAIFESFFFSFTFFYTEDPESSTYYKIYFVYRVIEDTLLVGLWCWVVDSLKTSYYWWCVGFYVVGVILELIFMLTYLYYSNPLLRTPKLKPKNDELKEIHEGEASI